MEAWKETARAKLLDLLHYRPDPCRANAERVEQTDAGDYQPQDDCLKASGDSVLDDIPTADASSSVKND